MTFSSRVCRATATFRSCPQRSSDQSLPHSASISPVELNENINQQTCPLQVDFGYKSWVKSASTSGDDPLALWNLQNRSTHLSLFLHCVPPALCTKDI